MAKRKSTPRKNCVRYRTHSECIRMNDLSLRFQHAPESKREPPSSQGARPGGRSAPCGEVSAGGERGLVVAPLVEAVRATQGPRHAAAHGGVPGPRQRLKPGAARIKASKRSKKPPCPGSIFEEFFIFALRFILLSSKSPMGPKVATNTAIGNS